MNLLQAVEVAAGHHVVRRRRHVIEAEKLLALELVHRKRARKHPRARVWNAHRFKHPLNTAVFAVRAVERDDRDINGRLSEHPVDVAVDEHLLNAVSAGLERLEHGFAGLQGDIALRAHAPEQYADVFILHSILLDALPMRRAGQPHFTPKRCGRFLNSCPACHSRDARLTRNTPAHAYSAVTAAIGQSQLPADGPYGPGLSGKVKSTGIKENRRAARSGGQGRKQDISGLSKLVSLPRGRLDGTDE